jgi:hypothetical protein
VICLMTFTMDFRLRGKDAVSETVSFPLPKETRSTFLRRNWDLLLVLLADVADPPDGVRPVI